jgi:hypothetical protein|tara:strand:- start:54 stop:347 length:294 start_codon:yes stop_codon:yes gene_type:complete
MKMEKWSEYDKYVVLADNSAGEIAATYESFLNYKKVIEVLNSMGYTDKSTYSYNNNIYNKKITSEDARKIVRNVSECKWNHQTEKLKIIARQIGLRV